MSEGFDRPSAHGKLLGEALAAMVAAGGDPGPMCATCAFRPGTIPNQSAGTGRLALNCALGIDQSPFACHHGMEDGQPTKLCAGYVAALAAPQDVKSRLLRELLHGIQDLNGAPDEVERAFDEWLARIDPNREKDVYELARLYLREAKAA